MPNAPPFEWLSDPKHRRSALVQIRRSIREGWLAGTQFADRRAALCQALGELVDSGTLVASELLTITQCLQAMEASGLKAEREELARSGIRLRGRPPRIRGAGSSPAVHRRSPNSSKAPAVDRTEGDAGDPGPCP